MKLLATRKSDQNQAVTDPWTVVHFGAGVALGLIEAPLLPVVLAAIGYELVEQQVERSEWGQRFFVTSGPESAANAVVDVVVLLGGYYLGRRYNQS